MKNSIKLFLIGALISLGLACGDDFLNKPPVGGLNQATLANPQGVEATLIGAYSLLDGWAQGWDFGGDVWRSAASNWVYGGICGGDANKGTDNSDQPAINPIARYEALSSNDYFKGKWFVCYDGVSRSNATILLLDQVTGLSAERAKSILAEATFLRAHYHFEAKRMFNNIPYISTEVAKAAASDINAYQVPNDKDTWPLIEADYKYAYDNLPEAQPAIGRINKWVAAASLARCYMFEKKYADAKALLATIIASGKTSLGTKFGLNDIYQDNFRIATKNSKEAIFSVQSSVNDGADGENGAYGDVLNFPYTGGPGECCGFYQPSLELVNSHKVNTDGLPFLDGSYNTPVVKNDDGIPSDKPFELGNETLDPRLDWSVGRRGVPYLDWGKHPGQLWIRDQTYAGPFSPKKHVFYKAEKGSGSTASGWAQGASANNTNLIRYAHILLWAAECEVEIGDLNAARGFVNQIRQRASNPAGFVKDGANNAANYKIGLYNTPWTDKAAARKAVQFEHKLEFAMEGHRFFDLVRWGIAAETLNAYLAFESKYRSAMFGGAKFTAGRNEYFPIPQFAIIASAVDGVPTLKQNPGY
jgi:hypothetical protein